MVFLHPIHDGSAPLRRQLTVMTHFDDDGRYAAYPNIINTNSEIENLTLIRQLNDVLNAYMLDTNIQYYNNNTLNHIRNAVLNLGELFTEGVDNKIFSASKAVRNIFWLVYDSLQYAVDDIFVYIRGHLHYLTKNGIDISNFESLKYTPSPYCYDYLENNNRIFTVMTLDQINEICEIHNRCQQKLDNFKYI